MRSLFLKLDTLMYLSSFSVVHRGLLSPTRDLNFLGNDLHRIALISQNKNRLTSFRRKLFVSGHFEPVIKPTNADAPDTQLV